MNTSTRNISICLAFTLSCVCAATAQWSSDPAVNLPVGDLAGDQGVPLIAATPDGGCYISWFDNSSGGYDVRLQRLDAAGNEMWAHNGIVVAARSFSYTYGYDLDVDPSGNAIMAYRDDRAGGEQVGANLISPDGTLLWGSAGVILTNTTAFIGSPQAAATTDGEYMIGWTQDSSSIFQRLDVNGNELWTTPVYETPAAGSYNLSDLRPSDNGGAIALFVHITGAFYSDKHLKAQKYNFAGGPMWNGGTLLPVYDNGSVQFGYFPTFKTDGAGGAVFGWYEVSGSARCRVQHVNALGAELFAHNGIPAFTNGDRMGHGCDVAYNSVSGDTYLFWLSSDPGQSAWAMTGQRFTADGTRQWTDSGIDFTAFTSTHQPSFMRALPTSSGVMVFYLAGDTNDHLAGLKLDVNGTNQWPTTPIHACTVNSGKLRVQAVESAGGMAMLVWGDGRADTGNIYAQNVNLDGSLGARSVARVIRIATGTLRGVISTSSSRR